MGHYPPSISVEAKRQDCGYRFTTECYTACQLIYVTEGALHFGRGDGDTAILLGPHAFVFLRPGGVFRLSCREEGYRGFAVFERGENPRSFRGAPITGLADGTVRMLGNMIQRHIDAPVPESGEILAGLGQALLWEALALKRERTRCPVQDWAEAVRVALEVNLGTALPVRDALTSLPLSYRQLCRRFRDRYGTSPKAYQELLRTDEARRMLAATDLDITAIATELGYSSSQHFATQFRQMTGCTPSAYRHAANP